METVVVVSNVAVPLFSSSLPFIAVDTSTPLSRLSFLTLLPSLDGRARVREGVGHTLIDVELEIFLSMCMFLRSITKVR